MSVEAVDVDQSHAADRDAQFKAFFTAEFPRLAGYCLRLLSDEQLARDTAQEALVRVWSRWFGVRDPHAYVYLVATNLVRGEWRDRARRAEAWQRAAEQTATEYEDDDRGLRDAVERLPDRLRVPMLLHYYADLPVAAVAAALRRPEGTVKRLLAEGRAALLQSLEDDR